MASISEKELKELSTRFDTVPFSTFFKLWYALQKALPPDKKGEILTKIGRTIGKEFDETGIETIDDFMSRLKQFLEKEWAITDNAKVEVIRNENGEVTKLIAKQDSCKMCFANTYYKFHDNGSPSCMFPQVVMGVLSKVKKKFGFRNLRYEGVQKGGVGVCAMMWNVK
jgi:predicted hydrocarbon binding protein